MIAQQFWVDVLFMHIFDASSLKEIHDMPFYILCKCTTDSDCTKHQAGAADAQPISNLIVSLLAQG